MATFRTLQIWQSSGKRYRIELHECTYVPFEQRPGEPRTKTSWDVYEYTNGRQTGASINLQTLRRALDRLEDYIENAKLDGINYRRII